MKRIPDFIRHAFLFSAGILVSSWVQSHALFGSYSPAAAEKNVVEMQVAQASIVPASVPDEKIQTGKRKVLAARTVPQTALKETDSDNTQSSPASDFDHMIRSTARNMAQKYSANPFTVERYMKAFCEYQYEIGIPSPVLMAIAWKESAFKSDVFRKTGNPFGIKASGGWRGPTYSVRRHGRTIKYRKYASAEEAALDFGKVLHSSWWYADALNCSFEDYAAVVHGLSKTDDEPGYALNPDWDEHILQLIEENDLARFGRR